MIKGILFRLFEGNRAKYSDYKIGSKLGGKMPASGLFITLFDIETLNLYLDRGVYGFHMSPIYGEVPTRSRHYAALADYACARDGTHVFFFLKRHIIYGGQIIGSKECGSFYINGPYSPIGRKVKARIVWDESNRNLYKATGKTGVFIRPRVNTNEVCQPYLIRFKDKLGIKGQAIQSDELYFELGEYPYPLPTNSISGMGFCTMTPGETERAIELIEKKGEESQVGASEEIALTGDPILFRPELGISNLEEAVSEAHLEASVIANPNLLPKKLRPGGASICRQVPISPFKPYQMDRADICYYGDNSLEKGTVPNVIIEVKNRHARNPEIKQIERYLKWLHKRFPSVANEIELFLLAPSFAQHISVPSDYRDQVNLITFDECR